MSDLSDVKKGDTVIVHFTNWRRQPVEGAVEKAGPKLLHVRYENAVETFRRENGRKNDGYGHIWINTPEQEDNNRRRSAAFKTINDHGLYFRLSDDDWSLARLEALADFLQGAS